MNVALNVIIPDKILPKQAPRKVLWLLHGAAGDHTDWGRKTSVERYANDAGLCVVMPSAHMSLYRDMAHGGAFFTYIADELPKLMRRFFGFSESRADNFVCGLSMGGAGALRIALHRPEQYAAAACFSAGLSNYLKGQEDYPEFVRLAQLAFGDESPSGEMAQLQALARDLVAKGAKLPRLYHRCGTEDFLLGCARETRDFFLSLNKNPFGYVYEEGPGAHTWDYWDEGVRKFIAAIGEDDGGSQK